MAIKLWWAVTPGQADQSRDDRILRNKKKVKMMMRMMMIVMMMMWQVLKMMMVVVLAFSMCWLPWQAYHLVSTVAPLVNSWSWINYVFFSSHMLAMSNSCYNPFIYAIFSVSPAKLQYLFIIYTFSIVHSLIL